MDELNIRDGRCFNRENGRFEVKSDRRGSLVPLGVLLRVRQHIEGTIVPGLDEPDDGGGFPVTGVTNARRYRNLRR